MTMQIPSFKWFVLRCRYHGAGKPLEIGRDADWIGILLGGIPVTHWPMGRFGRSVELLDITGVIYITSHFTMFQGQTPPTSQSPDLDLRNSEVQKTKKQDRTLLQGRRRMVRYRDLSPTKSLWFSPWDSGATITTRLRSFFFVGQDVYGTVPASMAMMLANCISLAWVGASQIRIWGCCNTGTMAKGRFFTHLGCWFGGQLILG